MIPADIDIPSKPPCVIPRVFLPRVKGSVPLVDALELLIERRDIGQLRIEGHLAFDGTKWALNELMARSIALSPKVQLVCSDGNQHETVDVEIDAEKINCVSLRFISWSDEQIAEYAMSKYPADAKQILARIRSEAGTICEEDPLLWSCVIDQLSDTGGTKSVIEYKIDELQKHLVARNYWAGKVDELACLMLIEPDVWVQTLTRLSRYARSILMDESLRNAIMSRYYVSQLKLFLESKKMRWKSWLTDRLKRKTLPKDLPKDGILHFVPPGPVVRAAADAIRNSPELMKSLEEHFQKTECSAAVASLLLAAEPNWRLPLEHSEDSINLCRGFFPHACWNDCKLTFPDFQYSDLSSASLSNGNIQFANLTKVLGYASNWTGSKLEQCNFAYGDFSHASFSRCRMRNSQFFDCVLDHAVLSHADLRRSNLNRASLINTSFRFAKLARCDFSHSEVVRCDFSFAALVYAKFSSNDLRDSKFEGTNFSMSRLAACELEGLRFDNCRFYRTKLRSCTMTGTAMDGLDLRRSYLRNCRLGEISWTDCDLREADLRGCTFHFGSTRCGMVDSPYPSHGTRTGFYTDDLERLYFEAPESVRRGNMQGCDLRGANIEGVDFYLIDLRGAKLDLDQERHVAATGAILC